MHVSRHFTFNIAIFASAFGLQIYQSFKRTDLFSLFVFINIILNDLCKVSTIGDL